MLLARCSSQLKEPKIKNIGNEDRCKLDAHYSLSCQYCHIWQDLMIPHILQ